MGYAYTPGLKVTSRMRHRVRRILPIAGDVLVRVGDAVAAGEIVARSSMPGDVTPINLANQLSLPPGDVPECMLKSAGERVEVGDVLARTRGIFGLFKSEYRSKVAGTLESISKVTGQLMIRGEPIPVEVRAYLAGKVTEVIPNEGVVVEAAASYVQGIFGIGGEAFGPIHIACADHTEELSAELIRADMNGAVVVGGARVTGDAIRRAIDVGASAVVSGGMDDQDLNDILGYDLGVAVTGSEDVGVTVIVTEGFGDIAMAARTFELLSSRKGSEAAVNGATQIRAGVVRPEILVPLSDGQKPEEPETAAEAGMLQVGVPVRVIREPHFGVIGTVAGLPSELTQLDSESKARVLQVRFESGHTVVVPRANVELIEA